MRISIDRGSGTDLAGIRRENLHRVLEVARTEQGSSQNDIALRTGLGIAAVSSLVNELLAAGVLIEAAAPAARTRGRPKRAVELADGGVAVVGVSITRSRIEARAATLRGTVVGESSWSFAGPPTPAQAAEAVVRLVDEAVGAHGIEGSPPRLVVALPGAFTPDGFGGTELEWERVDAHALVEPLRARGWPEPLLGNDGSLAAFAEARTGAAIGHANSVVLFLGRGLGGSAIVDGALIRGATTAPGFGHTPLDPHGADCNCGLRGCAELSVSLRRFAERLGELRLLETATSDEFAREIARRADSGDERVLEVLADAGRALARLGDVVSSLLNPELVVLTGPGAVLSPWILPPRVGNTAVPTAEGALGGEAVIRGALAAAQELTLADPLRTGAAHPADWV